MFNLPIKWPNAEGICAGCFEPIRQGESFRVRPTGRAFHKPCYENNGYYVRLEKRLASRESRDQ